MDISILRVAGICPLTEHLRSWWVTDGNANV
jgi:hypothetical protein